MPEVVASSSPVVSQDFLKKLERIGFTQDRDLIALCRKSYKGGKEYITKTNLFKHTRELEEEYQDRLKRAYFLNYTSPIVDTYTFFLFKSPISRSYNSEALLISTFIENVDNKGTSLNEFMKSVSTELLNVGRQFIVVDAPSASVDTKAQELEQGIRPYVYTIATEDVLDFEEDDDGLVWIKFKERREKKGSWDYDGDGYEDVIVIWDRTAYTSYDPKGNVVDNIANLLGHVPIIKAEFQSGDPYIKDISLVNRAIFNWCSLLDEILYRQTFSQLVIPQQSDVPLSQKQIGTSWAWTYDPDSKHPPSFISPDVSQGTLIADQINTGILEVYRLANLDWSHAQTAGKSGVAKAYDFMNVNKALAALAFVLQEVEKKIFILRALYYGEEVSLTDAIKSKNEVTITYPQEFSYIAISDKLLQLYEAINMSISAKFSELCKKQVVDIVLPAVNEDDKKTIFKEIEEAALMPQGIDPITGLPINPPTGEEIPPEEEIEEPEGINRF